MSELRWHEKPLNVFAALVVGAGMGVVLMSVLWWAREDYRQGQIDALSGSHVKYELRDQPDGSRVWVEKETR